MFKGELTKFCQHNGHAGYFSHPEQGLEEASIHYFNNFYFLRVHPNLIGIACCGMYQRLEKVTV
jgi:hypothetical protein